MEFRDLDFLMKSDKPVVVMGVGLRGCGKTEFFEELSAETGFQLLSVSAVQTKNVASLRDPSEEDMAYERKRAFSYCQSLAQTAINEGRSVIIDAGYIKPNARRRDTRRFKKFGAKVIAVVFEPEPLETPADNCSGCGTGNENATECTYHLLVNNPPLLDEGFSEVLHKQDLLLES